MSPGGVFKIWMNANQNQILSVEALGGQWGWELWGKAAEVLQAGPGREGALATRWQQCHVWLGPCLAPLL